MLAVAKWLQEIITSVNGDLISTLEKLKERYGIQYKLYQNSVILNYDLRNNPYPNSDIVNECRALQLSIKDFSVISRAFNRFLNYGESGTEDFEFDSNSVVFDKIDGTLTILYYSEYKQSWVVRTRKTAFAEATVSSIHSDIQRVLDTDEYTFHQLIESVIAKSSLNNISDLNDTELDKSNSYIFEFVSPESRVITPYQERALFYITTFNNQTGEEQQYKEGLQYIQRFINNVKDIPRHKLTNRSVYDIISLAKQLPPSSEGYVVRNNKNQRVKIKNPAYVALHLLHNNGALTDKRILELIEISEDSEYLTYFPEEKYRFDFIKEQINELLKSIQDTYNGIKDINEQKDYAKQATQYPFSSILFQLRTGKELHEIWNNLKISYKEKLLCL